MSESTPPHAARQPTGVRACPNCGADVAADESFCEACGTQLQAEVVASDTPGSESPVSLSTMTRPVPGPAPEAAAAPPCRECGGEVGEDGYCTQCGSKAPLPRDHFTEAPASWVGGSCDRGVRHHRNEDAMALAVSEETRHAVLVVCDGVSTSTDSDVASLAAARAARDELAANRPQGMATPESRAAAIVATIKQAAKKANEAVIANTAPDSPNAASCTFVVGVVSDGMLVYGNTGDSRAYWIPDDRSPLLLTTDDSMAQVRIAAGVPRDEAENGPGAHAITRWLGKDSEDVVPRCSALELVGAGWVVVCSDGLWNYASSPEQVRTVLTEAVATGPTEPVQVADRLVSWANAQGGKDNVTVALARIEPASPPAPVNPVTAEQSEPAPDPAQQP